MAYFVMNAATIPLNRLYSDLAYLWPLVSPPEDYAEEAAVWRLVLREHLGPGRHALLEMGVGGGHNLSHFAAEFDAVAVDLAPEMLEHSRRLNPSVEHLVGDMRSLRLGRRFAAVLVHDAASYLLTQDEIEQTFATAAAHLGPGGLCIASPDDYVETFVAPSVDFSTHAREGRELTFIEYSHDPDPSDTWIETIMLFLIREGQGLRIEHDRHRCGLFPRKTWLDAADRAGFDAQDRRFTLGPAQAPYSLLVGRKR